MRRERWDGLSATPNGAVGRRRSFARSTTFAWSKREPCARRWSRPEELRRLLEAFGLHPLAAGRARSEDGAAGAASVVGFPVVLKLDSPDVLHKTEAGGVRLDLRSEDDVRTAFRDMSDRFPGILEPGGRASVVVQPMVRGGVETLIGVTDDHTFGPLIAFGLGGAVTEVLRDVAFRLAPLTERDAADLVRGIRGFRLLQGYRGSQPSDIHALEEVLLRVSLLAQHVPELRELDLNPVIALPSGQGCRIVDARARVSAN
jgi:acyl-CoA synthetase (NDP forming)